jgi:nucleotide-binding universal stress UspA family protein
MFAKIVVPLDGSPLGQSALPYALAIADAARARVTLLAVNPPSDAMLDGGLRYDAAAEAAALASAGTALETLAGSVQGPHRQVDTHVTVGDPAAEILRHVERTGSDLVAMATHGRGGVLHWAFGSVARKVLTAATVPLLIVRPDAEPEHPERPAAIGSILVPLDGSERAEQILPLVEALAPALGASVTLARVLHTPGAGDPFTYTPVMTQASFDKGVREWREATRRYLDRVQDRLTRAGIPVATLLREGPAAVTLLDLLAAGGYDLVAMTTHGRTGVKRWVLGSVAERLVEASHTPILLLRSEGHAP